MKMAFGKDDENLKKVARYGGTHSQMAAYNSRKRAPKKNTKRNVPYWANQYKPSMGTPDTVRIIPGEYSLEVLDDENNIVPQELPFYQYTEHYHGPLRKGFICSAGPFKYQYFSGNAEQCLGCDTYWADRDGPISMRGMYVYTVIDTDVFHKAPQIGRDGQPRVSPKTGEAYYNWEKGSGGPGAETKVGHKMTWAMGKMHHEALWAYDEHVSSSCSSCGGRATISSMVWQCGNAECGDIIFAPANTDLSYEAQKEVSQNPYSCPTCKETFFPHETYGCSACDNEQRASIFDVDITLKRQKSDAMGTQLVILATSDPKPVDDHLAEFAQPMDLPSIYIPENVDRQAELLGVTVSHTQPYA
jgi:hypothetical protein